MVGEFYVEGVLNVYFFWRNCGIFEKNNQNLSNGKVGINYGYI